MAQEIVNVGTSADDGTGDTARSGMQKVNSNFTELYAAINALAETIRDTMGSALVAGSGVTITVNDAGDTITIAADAEVIRDTVAAFAAAGSGITVTHNDAGDTLTIAADAEFIRDTVAAFLTAGSNVTVTHDDVANTLTVAATGGGSALPVPATPASGASQWGYPFAVASGFNSNTGTIGRNQLYYFELYVPTAITITGVAIRAITAAPAAWNVRVGIVAQGTDRQPTGNSLLDTVIACSTTGSTVYSTTGLSCALTPGRYLVAWAHDSATDINFTIPSSYATIGATFMDSAFSASMSGGALIPFTYPASWPTPMPAHTAYVGNRHIVHMRWT